MSSRRLLKELIINKAIVKGSFVLSSGSHTEIYVDLRKITLDSVGAPLVGAVMADLTKSLKFDAVGGLTLGADPIAAAMLHASAIQGVKLDAFIVRKSEKSHGLQRKIEGPDISGKRVLIVEDTSTTGKSALNAIDAVLSSGATVVGVAVLLDRGGVKEITANGFTCFAAYEWTEIMNQVN